MTLLQGIQINKRLLPVKLVFTLVFGGQSCLLAFISVYFHDVGLSGAQIGFLLALRPFMGFFASPLINLVADKTNRHHLIFILSIAISTLLRFSFWFVGNQFYVLLVLTILAEIIFSPAGSLLNHFVLQLLGDNKEAYGKQRLYGAVGAGAFSLIIGSIISATQNYAYAFGSFLIISYISLYPCYLLKTKENSYEKMESSSTFKDVLNIFTNYETSLIFAISFVMGIATGIHETYLYIYLEDIGGTKLLLGICWAISCTSELPFFFFSGNLIQKITPRGALLLSIGCFALRQGYYALLTNPWAVLPAEILHGVTYAIFWSASVTVVSNNADPKLAATAQGLLYGFYEGLGAVTGTIIGGLMYDSYGAKLLFSSTSIALFIVFVSFLVLQFPILFSLKTKLKETEQVVDDKELVVSKTSVECVQLEDV